MAKRLELPKFQAFLDTAHFLSGGKVWTYEAGTSTPKATYTTPAGDVENTNPVILDSRGAADIYLKGSYKINILDDDDVQVTGWPVDNVNGGIDSDDAMGSYYYPDYTAVDQGITGDSNTINYAVETIDTDNGAIYLRHNSGSATTTYTLTTSETIPSNIKLVIEKGVILDGAGTLTINGQVEVGHYKIFGTVTVAFGAESNPDNEAVWFGFSPSASAAVNDAAFDKAVASMYAGQRLITGQGNHLIVNIVFDPPDGCGWLNYGNIESNGEAGIAVTIGDSAGATYVMKYNIQNLKVISTAKMHTSGRIGVLIRNCYESYIDIRHVFGFEYGIKLYGDGHGCVYNEIHLGTLHDNKFSLFLTAANSGWCNENNFYGGRFYWTSAQDISAFIHIWIDYYVTYKLNNNRFYSPSLECRASTGADTELAIYNEGLFSYFYSPRFEMTDATIDAEFTANSTDSVIFFGYGLLAYSDITDSGTNNKIFTRNDMIFSGGVSGTSISTDPGVLRVQNTATETTAAAISIHGIDNVVNARLYGDGDIDINRTFQVNGVSVVGAQGAAVADATDAASVILRLNDLLARLRAHGLIAT